jgi:hypothetical protein
MIRPKGSCSVCGRRFTPIIRAHEMDHPNLFGGVDTICHSCWTKQMNGGTVQGNGASHRAKNNDSGVYPR